MLDLNTVSESLSELEPSENPKPRMAGTWCRFAAHHHAGVTHHSLCAWPLSLTWRAPFSAQSSGKLLPIEPTGNPTENLFIPPEGF